MNTSVDQSLLRSGIARGPKRRTVDVLGSKVDILDVDDAVALVQGWIEARDGQSRQVVAALAHPTSLMTNA